MRAWHIMNTAYPAIAKAAMDLSRSKLALEECSQLIGFNGAALIPARIINGIFSHTETAEIQRPGQSLGKL
jgi:hypothetical protein